MDAWRHKKRRRLKANLQNAFIRRPSCASVIGGDHYSAAEIVSATATSLPDITQAENRTRYWRRTRERPSSAAVTRNCSAGIIWISRVQIAAADDSVVRITKIDRECTAAGSTKQRSVVCVPSVSLIGRGENSRDVSSASGNPRVTATLR